MFDTNMLNTAGLQLQITMFGIKTQFLTVSI